MIITIDGPAGAGKSSVARALARRLGFRFLDTGAMYRCVALAAMKTGIDWDDDDAIASFATTVEIQVGDGAVRLNGQDVTEAIRTMEVTNAVHYVADNGNVRDQLADLQRRTAGVGDWVTEGRDQGTVVFPDATCKIFLTASREERARRRQSELADRGEILDFATVLDRQNNRDEQDRTREVGALLAADDAIHVDTSGLSLNQVVTQLESIARRSIPQPEKA